MWSRHLRVRTVLWNEDERVWNWIYRFAGEEKEVFIDREIIYISWLEGSAEWTACVVRKGVKVYLNENNLEVIKIKSLIKAKELGWNIKSLS